MTHLMGAIKTDYDLHRDPPRVLRMLLVCALTERRAVEIVATDDGGVVRGIAGVPFTVTEERLTVRLADGGTFRCPLWHVDRASVADMAEGLVA